MYRVEVAPAAERDLERLGRRVQRRTFERLRAAISGLASEPRPHGVRKIEGAERAYRIRVGDYRAVYEIYDRDDLVVILQVSRRTGTTYR